MKKYAVIAACLIGASSVLQTQGFAQTGAGSPGASPSGTESGQPGSQPGKVDAGNPPAGQPSESKDGIINEPSGAQAGKSGVLRTSGGGKVRYQRDDAGVLTLQGNVANEAQKQAIEEKVKSWPGVSSVQNMLQVQEPGKGINEPSGAERQLHQSSPSGPDSAQPDQKNP